MSINSNMIGKLVWTLPRGSHGQKWAEWTQTNVATEMEEPETKKILDTLFCARLFLVKKWTAKQHLYKQTKKQVF